MIALEEKREEEKEEAGEEAGEECLLAAAKTQRSQRLISSHQKGMTTLSLSLSPLFGH